MQRVTLVGKHFNCDSLPAASAPAAAFACSLSSPCNPVSVAPHALSYIPHMHEVALPTTLAGAIIVLSAACLSEYQHSELNASVLSTTTLFKTASDCARLYSRSCVYYNCCSHLSHEAYN
eukprot:11416-Heterococcus_DN1.PRE.2